MKKILSLVIVLIFLTSLFGCSSSREIVKKDKKVDVVASLDFLNGIDGGNPNKDYYYTSDSMVFVNKKLNNNVWSLEKYSKHYLKAIAMADSNFYIFQADIDNNDNITRLAWVASITKDPSLRLLEKGNYPGTATEKKETMAGKPRTGKDNDGKVKLYKIRAVKLGRLNDQYFNVEDREAQDTRYTISWDRDAFPNVEYVKQIKDRLNQSNEVYVEPGDNEAVIDIRKGRLIKLCWISDGEEVSPEVNPYKVNDLILEGLTAVSLGEDYWLRINIPAYEPVKKETLDKDRTYKFRGIMTPLPNPNLNPVKKTYKPKIVKPKEQPKPVKPQIKAPAKVRVKVYQPATPQSYEINGTIIPDPE